MDTHTEPARDAPPRRPRRARAALAQAWSGLGPIRSLRGSLLLVTVIAITPLVAFASGMALLRAWDAHRLSTTAAWITVSAAPLLVGVGAVVLVGIATEAMVLQWLAYLERLSRAYARGRYSLRPRRLLQAPLEFHALGEAVEYMAAAVQHRDQALRDALGEQTILLREVHHRVKNNLQIVASLLSLQASRAADPGVREALQDALVRIDALSLGQRFMQQKEEEDTVSAVELFEALLAQVRARLGTAGRTLNIVADIEPMILPLDTGSRLALVAAEALVCAFRAGAPDTLQGRMTVRAQAGGVSLLIETPGQPDAFAGGADRVSRDLISGYIRQLHAQLVTVAGSGSLSVFAPLADPVQNTPAPSAAPPAGAAQGLKFFRNFDRTRSRLVS